MVFEPEASNRELALVLAVGDYDDNVDACFKNPNACCHMPLATW